MMIDADRWADYLCSDWSQKRSERLRPRLNNVDWS